MGALVVAMLPGLWVGALAFPWAHRPSQEWPERTLYDGSARL
jgi:hypothetical protein